MTICSSKTKIIIVDLDGSLIKTDSMIESIISVLKDNPLRLFTLFTKSLKGKIDFKKYVFEHCNFPSIARFFPVNHDLVDYLKEEKEKGTKLYLVSASDERAVKATVSALGLAELFDRMYGTSNSTNLKGKNKLEFIKNSIAPYHSEPEIIYCGDNRSDIELWKDESISGAVLVGNKTAKIEEKLADINLKDKIDKVIPQEKAGLKDYLYAMRVHQWSKNALLFVPLLCSFTFFDIAKDLVTLLAFISFSLVASATYILNDLYDLSNDRVHPTKCKRVFASGKVSIVTGGVTACLLLFLSAAIAIFVSRQFFFFLLFYFGLTTSYSLFFKRLVLIDIIVLASLYVTRIVAGNVVCNIEISYWLLSFAFMIFLSLGTLKRYVELQKKVTKLNDIEDRKSKIVIGRGYLTEDLGLIMPLGISAYIGSVVLLGLYITSSDMVKNYSTPELLWFVQMIFLYLIGDMLCVVIREIILYEPVLFVVKDKKCLMCLVAITSLAILAYFV